MRSCYTHKIFSLFPVTTRITKFTMASEPLWPSCSLCFSFSSLHLDCQVWWAYAYESVCTFYSFYTKGFFSAWHDSGFFFFLVSRLNVTYPQQPFLTPPTKVTTSPISLFCFFLKRLPKSKTIFLLSCFSFLHKSRNSLYPSKSLNPQNLEQHLTPHKCWMFVEWMNKKIYFNFMADVGLITLTCKSLY